MPKLVVEYRVTMTIDKELPKSVFDFLNEREKTENFDEVWTIINDELTQSGLRMADEVTAIYAVDGEETVTVAEF